jgi:hypothetical protein
MIYAWDMIFRRRHSGRRSTGGNQMLAGVRYWRFLRWEAGLWNEISELSRDFFFSFSYFFCKPGRQWGSTLLCQTDLRDEPGDFLGGSLPIRGLFAGIQSGRNNRYIKKFVIETRIHSGLRFNLLIMISRTRDRRAGLIPHLLTSGLIPSLIMCLSRVN